MKPSWGPALPPLSALVVEPGEIEKAFLVTALTSVGFHVTATDNFGDARASLITQSPFALLTEVRLGEYNGLQLALRGRLVRSNMAVLVISEVLDPVLEREAENAGATFVVKPMTRPELLAALYRTALRPHPTTGTAEPIRPPFERRRGDRRTSVAAGVEQERRVGVQRRQDVAERLLRVAASVVGPFRDLGSRGPIRPVR